METQCTPQQFLVIALFVIMLCSPTRISYLLTMLSPFNPSKQVPFYGADEEEALQYALGIWHIDTLLRRAASELECLRMKVHLSDSGPANLGDFERSTTEVLKKDWTTTPTKSRNHVRSQRNNNTENNIAAEKLKKFLQGIEESAACDVVTQVSSQVWIWLMTGVLRNQGSLINYIASIMLFTCRLCGQHTSGT